MQRLQRTLQPSAATDPPRAAPRKARRPRCSRRTGGGRGGPRRCQAPHHEGMIGPCNTSSCRKIRAPIGATAAPASVTRHPRARRARQVAAMPRTSARHPGNRPS